MKTAKTRSRRWVVVLDGAAGVVRPVGAVLRRLRCVVVDPGTSIIPPSVAVLGIQGHPSEIAAVAALRQAHGDIPILLIARTGSEALAVEALRAGVREYLTEDADEILVLEALDRLAGSAAGPKERTDTTDHPLIGESAAMRAIRTRLPKIARSECSVLITGDTGTGKECVARALHAHSRRASRPLVSLNCAAIPDSLLENELFGHEAGAFTGARGATPGRLEAADGGTVFLDEVGDMSPLAQAKVLRALEDRAANRLGGDVPRSFDVRFIAATNRSLDAMMQSGTFRRDLYFRLNVVHVEMPPLVDRLGDIPLLASHLLRRRGAPVVRVDEDCLELLHRHTWPGNVRELANVLEAAAIQADDVVRARDLPAGFLRALGVGARPAPTERERMLRALEATHWNKSRAARKLQWSRMTLYRKMAKYGIDPKHTDDGSGSLTESETGV